MRDTGKRLLTPVRRITIESGLTQGENDMAKGQMRQTKEKKKPKADSDKPKQVSAYKQSLQSTPKK